MLVIWKSQLGKLSRNSHYVTFFLSDIYFLVSSKVEFLLHKELSTLFYFDQTGYTNVDITEILLSPQAGKMERTLCFGSLPGRLARSGFSTLVLQENVIRVVGHIINSLLTELVRPRLVDTGLFSFAFLSATSYRSVKKNARTQKQKKERGQYPDILTSRLVKNAYMLNEHHAFTMLRDL